MEKISTDKGTLSQKQIESPHKIRACHGWSRLERFCNIFLVSGPDTLTGIFGFNKSRDIHDRLGFSAEIQTIFGTV